MLTVASSLAIAQVGTITGRVTNEGSDTPMEGVLAAVDAPEAYGRHPSNSAGIYRLLRVPVGNWEVEFHCPSNNGTGREIEARSVAVEQGEIAVVNIEVPIDHCFELPYAVLESNFRGYVIFDFEYSRFFACDAESLSLSTNTFSGSSIVWARGLNRAPIRLEPNTLYYVEVQGMLEGPGRFGHLGMANHQLTIEEVEFTLEVEDQDCQRDRRGAA